MATGQQRRHVGAVPQDLHAAFRLQPCHDWWEEREGVHAATLACIAAGLEDELDLSRAEERLDASLLVLPFLGFGAVDIEGLVSPGGGVHRHLADTYYGGGEWVLLAGFLGWYHADRGDTARATQLLDWMAAQATENLELPEQLAGSALHPHRHDEWVERWGAIATPLLWSHGMYLTLASELGLTAETDPSAAHDTAHDDRDRERSAR